MKTAEVHQRVKAALALLSPIRGNLEGEFPFEEAFAIGELMGVCTRLYKIMGEQGEVEIRTPPSERVVDDVWVGLSTDEAGRSGICAVFWPGIGSAMMVTASAKVLEHLKGQAVAQAALQKRPIKIYRFVRHEVVFSTEDVVAL
jgi:hypothetical protein